MGNSVAAVVLAAGAGTRLAPLTMERPKALCPVDGVALVDRALATIPASVTGVAVNVHDRAEQLLAHVGERAHVSLEAELMGTGGALGILRPWIDGRDVLLLNVDCVHDADLATFVASWSPESIAFLLAEPGGTEFGPGVRLVATLMPWSEVATRPVERHSVFSRSWVPAVEAGTVETNWHAGAWFDCGTPEQYLAANLWCSGGVSVVGAEAVVDGTIEKCVVWDGAWVRPQERLVAAIRTTNGRTVLVR